MAGWRRVEVGKLGSLLDLPLPISYQWPEDKDEMGKETPRAWGPQRTRVARTSRRHEAFPTSG
jgi:hypothetical protein